MCYILFVPFQGEFCRNNRPLETILFLCDFHSRTCCNLYNIHTLQVLVHFMKEREVPFLLWRMTVLLVSPHFFDMAMKHQSWLRFLHTMALCTQSDGIRIFICIPECCLHFSHFLFSVSFLIDI